MSQALPDWTCGSGCSPPRDCRLRTCSNVAFPYTFSGSGKVGAQCNRIVFDAKLGPRVKAADWEGEGLAVLFYLQIIVAVI